MPVSELALVTFARRWQDVFVAEAARTARDVGLLWDRIGGITDAEQAAFAAAASRRVAVSQRSVAEGAERYLRAYIAIAGGAVAAERIVFNPEPRGVPGGVVYARPSVTARTALGNGSTFERAMQLARERAVAAAHTDVALAQRDAAHAAMAAQPAVLGWRRLPNPNACTYCVTASTKRYSTGHLQELHTFCDCSFAAIVGDADPGAVINKAAVSRLKAMSDRPDYWNDPAGAFAVREHGELGPVYVAKGDNFTGPNDLA